jgi:hypothetical protein
MDKQTKLIQEEEDKQTSKLNREIINPFIVIVGGDK